MNKIKIKSLLLAFVFNATALLPAQEAIEENQSQSDDLQKEFVILESVREHVLNPQITQYSSDSAILTGLFEGLFTYNPVTLEPQYALATGYKISRDKKRWTITLRENAHFSNGELITADSVRFSWLQLLGTQNAPYASLLDIIRGAEDYRNGRCPKEDVGIYAVDDHTLSIYLVKPANYLPKVLCHTAFSVVHKSATVYSGPYVLADYKPNAYILKKNQQYWDAESVTIEQITFMQSDDEVENTYRYNVGQADWVTGPVVTDKILDASALQFNTEFGTSYYFFKNSGKKPSKTESVWDNIDFRAAVFEAFPWEKLRERFTVPATTFVYPLTGYPQIEGYSYTDKIEAEMKMKEARKNYGISEDELISLTFAVPDNVSDDFLIPISDALKEIGVELVVQYYPTMYYISSVPYSEADLFMYTWIGDFADPLAFLELFHGDSTLNDSGWKNEEFDSLIDQAALVSDIERYQLLGKAEEILLDSCMVMPINHPVSFNLIDTKEVGGWTPNAFDFHSLKYLYKKYQKVDGTVVLNKF